MFLSLDRPAHTSSHWLTRIGQTITIKVLSNRETFACMMTALSNQNVKARVIFALFKSKWNIKYYLKWISTFIMQYCRFNFSEQLAVRVIL